MTRLSLGLLLVVLSCSETKRTEGSASSTGPTSTSSGSNAAQPEVARAAPAPAAPAPAPAAAPMPSGSTHPAMLNPALAAETAPARYSVRLDTTKGDIFIDVERAWSPLGADRFYNLVKIGYFTNVSFFRVISGFMAQVGIHGDPAVNRVWRDARIQDDPARQSNTRGQVTFATAGPNTRTSQFFINFTDNSRLDSMGFSPFGKVRDMAIVDQLYSGYGEGRPRGMGPDQGRMQAEGDAYLRAEFPNLDYIRSASIVE